MKKYTSHFLLITILTAIFGFSGLEFMGDSLVRFTCLVASIGLLISCLDAVILSKKKRKLSQQTEKVKAENKSEFMD